MTWLFPYVPVRPRYVGLVSMFTQPIQRCVRQVRWETTSGAGTDISIHHEAS